VAPKSAPPAVMDPADAKPSPVGPKTEPVPRAPPTETPAAPQTTPAPTAPDGVRIKAVPEPAVRASAAQPQEFTLLGSPAGATATVDGNRALSCATPCSLIVPQGRHTVTLTLAGAQLERRDFTV